jgi:hypothetical protein
MVRKCRQVNLSVMRDHDIASLELIQWEVVEINDTDDLRAITFQMLPQDARLLACQQGLERAGGGR